jgi:hypothetical protein
MQGKPLHTNLSNSRGNTAVTIEGRTLTPGLYLYALVTDNQVVDVKKLILTE